MGQDGAKLGQVGGKLGQVGAKMDQVGARSEPSWTRWTNMTDKTANLDQHRAKLVQVATNFGNGGLPRGGPPPDTFGTYGL